MCLNFSVGSVSSNSDTDCCLVVANVTERLTLTLSKCAMQTFHMDRFSLKELNKVEDKEQY
jgi:hypothetical protein